MSQPLRPGDVWLANLSPVAGSEQGGRGPALIVSGALHLALARGRLRGAHHKP